MLIFLNSNKKWFVFLFFLSFFLLGIFITPDYGVSIDEDNTRIVGFLTLESIFKIFSPEHLIQVNEIIAEQKSEHPNLDIVPTSGVTFDLPMAFLELIFNKSALAFITLLILLPVTDPGQIALTLILNSPNSIARDFVIPIIAHLLAA